MKKKFKILAACVALVSCLTIFAGCKASSISAEEFHKVAANAGNAWLETHKDYEKFEDFSIKATTTSEGSEENEYTLSTGVVTKIDTEKETSTIKVNVKNLSEDVIEVQVETYSNVQETTHKVEADAITEKVTNTVYHKIQTLRKKDGAFVQLDNLTVTVDGVVDEDMSYNKKYAFATEADYVNAVKEALADTQEVVSAAISAVSSLESSATAEISYTKKGKTVSMKVEENTMRSNSYGFVLEDEEYKMSFVNNKLTKMVSKIEREAAKADSTTESTLEFEYSATAITTKDVTYTDSLVRTPFEIDIL